ncbi:MAG: hypothetical protein Q8Q62_15280 [Mesorhizobium sp.]|nr:hypothetical protein [Mesorhizobium sp.]
MAMDREAEWHAVRGDSEAVFGMASMGVLRVALLFGSAMAALALIIAPIADSQTRPQIAASGPGLDRMTTGSTSRGGGYTIRRSVLQASPNSICVIHSNGARSGDCN